MAAPWKTQFDRSPYPCLSTDRPPGSLYWDGFFIFETDTGQTLRWSSALNTYVPVSLSAGRNLLDNGDFIVCQRENQINGTSATIINLNQSFALGRGADRWNYVNGSGLGSVTLYPSYPLATAGDPGVMGMFVQNGSTAGAMGSTNLTYLRQIISSERMLNAMFGRAEAKPLTLSFWVLCTAAGTYVAELEQINATRRCSQAYTISAGEVNHWVYKTVTFPPDTATAVTLLTTGYYLDGGVALNLWMSAGSTYNTGNVANLNTSWSTPTNNTRAAGQVNSLAAASGNMGFTHVQLEIGSSPSSYEVIRFSEEQLRCFRWYYRFAAAGSDGYAPMAFGITTNNPGGGATTGVAMFDFPVPMVKTPTVSTGGSLRYTDERTGATLTGVVVNGHINRFKGYITWTSAGSSGIGVGAPILITGVADPTAFVAFDAETAIFGVGL